MAHHDVQFPPIIAQGAQVIRGFSTSIIETSGGNEQRNANWSRPRLRWNVGTGLQRRTDTDALLAFFEARLGQAHSFRFKDWSDYVVARQTIGTTNGVLAALQIRKAYVSGPTTVYRPIRRPVSGTVQVWVNGVSIAAGAGGSQYQVDLATGIVTLGATLAGTTGQGVEAACQFDVKARFASDDIALSERSHETGEWPDIPVVEVRE